MKILKLTGCMLLLSTSIFAAAVTDIDPATGIQATAAGLTSVFSQWKSSDEISKVPSVFSNRYMVALQDNLQTILGTNTKPSIELAYGPATEDAIEIDVMFEEKEELEKCYRYFYGIHNLSVSRGSRTSMYKTLQNYKIVGEQKDKIIGFNFDADKKNQVLNFFAMLGIDENTGIMNRTKQAANYAFVEKILGAKPPFSAAELENKTLELAPVRLQRMKDIRPT